MSAPEQFARLTDELPEVEPVVPVVFVDRRPLAGGLALVEPTAFVLEYAGTSFAARPLKTRETHAWMRPPLDTNLFRIHSALAGSATRRNPEDRNLQALRD